MLLASSPSGRRQSRRPRPRCFTSRRGAATATRGPGAQPFPHLDRARDAARKVQRPLRGDVVVRCSRRHLSPDPSADADAGRLGRQRLRRRLRGGARRAPADQRRAADHGLDAVRPGRGHLPRAAPAAEHAPALRQRPSRRPRPERAGPIGLHQDRDRLHDDEQGDGRAGATSATSRCCPTGAGRASAARSRRSSATGSRWRSRAGTTPTSSSARRRWGCRRGSINAYELLDRPRQWYLDRRPDGSTTSRRGARSWPARTSRPPPPRCWSTPAGRSPIRSATCGSTVCTFEYATWMGVSGPQGYADDQTGFHVTGANQPQTFEHAQFTTRTPGNLRFVYAHDISDPRRRASAPGRRRGRLQHRQPARHDRRQQLQRHLGGGDPARRRRSGRLPSRRARARSRATT